MRTVTIDGMIQPALSEHQVDDLSAKKETEEEGPIHEQQPDEEVLHAGSNEVKTHHSQIQSRGASD